MIIRSEMQGYLHGLCKCEASRFLLMRYVNSNVMPPWCVHLAKSNFKYGYTCYVQTLHGNSTQFESDSYNKKALIARIKA
jgi:hypothetical protein